MTTSYRNYELNDNGETPWYANENALMKDIINKLPPQDSSFVGTEHTHGMLTNVLGNAVVSVGADSSVSLPLYDGTGALVLGANKKIFISATFGSTGIVGATGIQGSQGSTGLRGVTGIGGTNGSTGATGIQGTAGSQGSTGLRGVTGLQGTVGSTGATGIQGLQGNQGSTGLRGTTGIQGIQGTQGNTGIQGPDYLGVLNHTVKSGASSLADGIIVDDGTSIGFNTTPGTFFHLKSNTPTIWIDHNTYGTRAIIDANYSDGGLQIMADSADASADSRLYFGVDGSYMGNFDKNGKFGLGTVLQDYQLHLYSDNPVICLEAEAPSTNPRAQVAADSAGNLVLAANFNSATTSSHVWLSAKGGNVHVDITEDLTLISNALRMDGTVVINNMPGPYATNGDATTAGLVAGRIYKSSAVAGATLLGIVV